MWYPNLDGDDYTGIGSVSACAQPDKYVAVQSAEIDCNDNDSSIYPGAREIWYDGVDQNCDNADDYDQDGDGWRSAAETTDGEDCNDLLASVNPDEEEVCSNFLDDDCDGTDNGCTPTGEVAAEDLRLTVIDASGATDFGDEVSLGDLDGDGALEIGMGGSDKDLRVYEDSGDGRLPYTSTTLLMDYTDHLESWVASFSISGDFDGDDKADVVIGRNESDVSDGEALIWLSPETGVLSPDEADIVYYGPSSAESDALQFADVVGSVGDLDADLRDELLIAHPGGAGACYLLEGPLPASGPVIDAADLTLTLDPETPSTAACRRFSKASDIDDDGAREWGVGAYQAESVYFFESGLEGEVGLESGSPRLHASTDGALFGYVVGGGADMDGDDHPDLVVTKFGTVYVFFGPLSGVNTLPITGSFRVVDGTLSVGLSAGAGDFNGDGAADLVVSSFTLAGERSIDVFYGPLSGGQHTPAGADLRIDPVSDLGKQQVGAMQLAVGDTDGDGFDDIVFVATAGAVVVHGAGL